MNCNLSELNCRKGVKEGFLLHLNRNADLPNLIENQAL